MSSLGSVTFLRLEQRLDISLILLELEFPRNFQSPSGILRLVYQTQTMTDTSRAKARHSIPLNSTHYGPVSESEPISTDEEAECKIN